MPPSRDQFMSNTAFILLVGNTRRDILDLSYALYLFSKNLQSVLSIDVELFLFVDNQHTKNKVVQVLRTLANFELPPKVNVVLINLPKAAKRPSGKLTEYIPNPSNPKRPFSLGYRDMCSFFHYHAYTHDSLKPYKYVGRIDTDSFFLSKWNGIDLSSLDKINPTYCYLKGTIQPENKSVALGFMDAITAYAKSRKLKVPPSIISQIDNQTPFIYYTNFEILNKEWLLSEEYSDYANYIDESKGIYNHRWGDALTRYYGINLLANQSDIYGLTGVLYKHSGIYDSRSLIRRKLSGYYLALRKSKLSKIPYDITLSDQLFLTISGIDSLNHDIQNNL